MEKLFKVAHGLFVVAVALVGLLLLGSLVPVPGNYEVKVVASGSMEPSIKTGSIVVIKPQESYAVGDIITFGRDTRGSIPTTHRIIEERVVSGEKQFLTKGDANDSPDGGEVGEGEVIGKVLFDVPFLGFLLDFTKQPLGFILLVIIPAAIVVGDEFIKIFKEVARLRKKRGGSVSARETPSE